ncbi:P-loop containing nucleoside triphosphate hydrolase protein [Scheffersomyces coipomensis]|uniref:P-loop containing nucleoside triphosphate hydrolase protein n=1 Tax=Scheffersomyces coipomensis TaxID=1788519 RepID=UPI00315DF9DA
MVLSILRRTVSCNVVSSQRRYSSVNYLTAALAKDSKPIEAPLYVKKKKSTLAKQLRDKIEGLAISTKDLETKFWLEGEDVFTPQEMNQAQAFFNSADVELEWTIGNYEEIPDVKYKRLDSKRKSTLDNLDAFSKTEYHENLAKSRKTFGIAPGLIRTLPEVLLLGNTNAGKSTLINNLLVKKNANKIADYAYVSKRAGFTKTLNCFNIGGKLRLVDSPGYGEFGDEDQGTLVLDYIQKRERLAGALILIDSEAGIREEDINILSHLQENEIKHDVIFTKVDSVISKYYSRMNQLQKGSLDLEAFVEISKSYNDRIINHFEKSIESLPYSQRVFFSNSMTNKYTKTLSGYKQIRVAILQNCNQFQIPEEF